MIRGRRSINIIPRECYTLLVQYRIIYEPLLVFEGSLSRSSKRPIPLSPIHHIFYLSRGTYAEPPGGRWKVPPLFPPMMIPSTEFKWMDREARRGEARLAAASFASFKPPFFVGKPALSKWKYLMLRGKGFASISRCARTHARGLSRTATGTYAGDNRGGQSYNARPDYLVRVSNVVNSYWQRRWIYESQEMAVRSGFAICDRPRRVFAGRGWSCFRCCFQGDGDELWRMRMWKVVWSVLRFMYIREELNGRKCEKFKFISGEWFFFKLFYIFFKIMEN